MSFEIDKAEKEEVEKLKSDIFDVQEKKEKVDMKEQNKQDLIAGKKAEDPVEDVVSKGRNKVTFQFRYKNYKHILSILDEVASEKAGSPQNVVVKARNWRIDLDLDKPEDEVIYNQMMSSDQLGSDFHILKNIDKKKDKIKDRAGTLVRLNRMSHAQLMNILSTDELEEAGLVPGVPSKEELIMAIIDTKKLVD